MLKIKLKNTLYRTKTYWLFKRWLDDKPIFTFWAKIFKVDYNLERNRASARLLQPTLLPFVGTVIYASFIIGIFETYNIVVPVDKEVFSDAVVDTLLSAVASVAGVVLGLYFTAVSSIASNFLLRATQHIRRYFLSTPTGEQYVRTVAITAIVSIFYLTAKSFGHPIHPVGLLFLTLCGAYIIIRFWSVGSHVFYSLEPVFALPSIASNIIGYLKGVVPSGFKWNKPAIQNHLRRLVSDKLELSNDLVEFGIKELKLSKEQLHIALRNLGGLLYTYPEYKRKIPTASFWYKTKNQFESWSLADSTQIAIALNTGTGLQPKTIKDFTWFEDEILNTCIKVFSSYSQEKNVGSVFEGLELFVEIAEVYGKDFDDKALKLLIQKTERVVGMIQLTQVTDPKQILYKEQVAFVDTQGRLPIGALLGFAKYIDSTSQEVLSDKISKIDWISKDDIYLTDLPLAVLPRLESTASDIRNEIAIEGQQLSPQWYIRTLCIQQYVFSLIQYLDYLKSFHSDYFLPKLEKLLAENQVGLAVHLIQRWIEFTNKYENLIEVLIPHIDGCKAFHQVNDLPWITFNADEERKLSRDREKEVKDRMISLLPSLNTMTNSDELPDYFGQALTIGIQACYEACEDNDPTRLQSIFPKVFVASLSAHDMTRQQVQNWSEEQSKIIYSTEPLINLFELSGYARLYAELYQNQELWNVAQRAWDTYLSGVNAAQVIGFIADICNYRNGLYLIMPQATLRSNWQIRFSNQMREHGLAVFPDSESYDYVNGRSNPNHASAIIRTIVRSGGLNLLTGQTTFFATYLSNHPGAEGVDLPDRRDMQDQIRREEERENDNEEENHEGIL